MGKKEKGKKQAASNKETEKGWTRAGAAGAAGAFGDWFQARTDLALEERERFPGDGGRGRGRCVKREKERSGGFRLTEVDDPG